MSTTGARFMALYLLGVTANMCASFQAPLVAPLSKALGVAPNQIGFVMSAQFVAYLFGGSAIGRLVARIGVRPAAQGGLILIVLTLLYNWYATSLIPLIVSNLVQGLGMLTAVIAAQIGITMQAQGTGQARALATWATAPLIGIALGLLLSSRWADGETWRLAFPYMAGIGTVVLVMVGMLVKTQPTTVRDIPEEQGTRLTGEIEAIRLCLAVALVVLTINGSVSVWPTYLAKLHATTPGAIGAISSLAMLAGIGSSLLIGIALERCWGAARVLALVVPLAMASAIVVFIGLGRFDAAVPGMFAWNIASGGLTGLVFATLPTIVRNPANISAATGMLYQFSAVGAILGAPVFLALAELPHAGISLAGLVCVVLLALTLVFPFSKREVAHQAPSAGA